MNTETPLRNITWPLWGVILSLPGKNYLLRQNLPGKKGALPLHQGEVGLLPGACPTMCVGLRAFLPPLVSLRCKSDHCLPQRKARVHAKTIDNQKECGKIRS